MSEPRIYVQGERLTSKRDGQTYTVNYWDAERREYALSSRYFRFYVHESNMEQF